MDVDSFADIEAEFMARVSRTVWCTVATVDTAGRPRTRVLHPIWEGATGYIATGRQSHKAKHLARNLYVSLTYWDQQHQQVHVDARADWRTRRRRSDASETCISRRRRRWVTTRR